MKMIKIQTKFNKTKNELELLHPLDYLKLIQNISSFLEKQIKDLKKECKTPFKWNYYKKEFLNDWGIWSHKTNKILRQMIKDTENIKNKKLNKQYKYIYQYWWQSNFYLELDCCYVLPKRNDKDLYYNNKKELEKIIKKLK